MSLDISIVVPVYNEQENIRQLHYSLIQTLLSIKKNFEIIFVDDGSTDDSWDIMRELKNDSKNLKIIKLSRRFGQTSALACGIDYAQGKIIITMDADLQHDPREIPKFLQKIDEGFDLVSGWRKNRKDSLIFRKLPSRVANWMMSKISGIKIHDFGTTYKAYKKDVIKSIRLYGQLHRFIPVLSDKKPISVTEISISNVLRQRGRSSYNLGRTITVFFDLIRINFLAKYLSRPLQFFGLAGILIGLIGFLIASYLVYLKYFHGLALLTYRAPLFLLSIFLMLAGLQLLSIGFLGEIIVKVYHESKESKIYIVEETID